MLLRLCCAAYMSTNNARRADQPHRPSRAGAGSNGIVDQHEGLPSAAVVTRRQGDLGRAPRGHTVHEVFASQSGYSTDWRCPLQRLAAVYAPGRAYSLRCVLCRIESMYLMSVRQLLPLRHLIYLCLMASSEQIPRTRT